MGQSDRLLFALLLASMLPVFIAFLMGQSTMILLLGLTLVATGLRGRNDAAAGLGLAMLLIKPQLVVIPVALLVWRGRLRGLAYFAVGCLVVAGRRSGWLAMAAWLPIWAFCLQGRWRLSITSVTRCWVWRYR